MIHVDPSVFMDRAQNKSPSMNAWNGVPNSNVFDVRHSSPEIVELSESKSKIGNHVEEQTQINLSRIDKDEESLKDAGAPFKGAVKIDLN